MHIKNELNVQKNNILKFGFTRLQDYKNESHLIKSYGCCQNSSKLL